MSKTKELACYKQVMSIEHKRLSSSIEEASSTVLEEMDIAEDQSISTITSAHSITKTYLNFLWKNYIEDGFGEMLSLYPINNKHEMLFKPIKWRSQLDIFTGALRHMCNSVAKAYTYKQFLPLFSLNSIQERIVIALGVVEDMLKHLESSATWIEKYMSWVEHGAVLGAKYYNTSAEEDTEPADFYTDIRVKTYAFLKITELDSGKAVTFLEEISGLMVCLTEFVGLGQKLYASIKPGDFDYIFNALTNKKAQLLNNSQDGFENIHELNEFVKERVNASVENEDGFIYSVKHLLDETRQIYLSKLAEELTDLIALLPSTKAQKSYIRQFESGKLWQ